MAKYAGVDMSYCQPPSAIDYSKLKKAKIKGYTVKFAMLRFSYGKSKDNTFDEHYKGCKFAGIYVGAYHWLKALTPTQARDEAKWLIENLAPYKIDYPIALDFEDSTLFAQKYSKAQYTAIVDAFMSVLKEANYYVVLYTNPDTIRNRLLDTALENYDLWLAHYTSNPAQFGQTMWQYTAYGTQSDVDNGYALSVGSVSGANCPIDVNWCYVGYAYKIRKLGMNMPVNKYKITGTKTVKEEGLALAEKQLKSQGFSVSIEKI